MDLNDFYRIFVLEVMLIGISTWKLYFKMKLSKYYSYLNDKGSVRKRTNISGKSIPRFIPACRYSTIRPFSRKWSPSLIPACRSLRGNTVIVFETKQNYESIDVC